MIKKLLLAASIALCVQIPVVGAETISTQALYQDIEGHWAEKEITQLYENQVVKSNDAGMFRPDEPITRAELICMIMGAKRIEPIANKYSNFSDVSTGNWFSPYAETAYQLGLIHGQKIEGKTYFKPGETVQRQELISLFLQANGESGRVNQVLWSTTYKVLSQYPDNHGIDQWNQRPYVYALSKNMVTPVEGKQLQPTKIVSRAEAAQYVYKNLLQPNLQYQGWQQLNGSSASFNYKRVMSVQTTAYNENGIESFLGWPLRHGLVSVDPTVIPLGTHLYIEGYGYAVAADIGSAVKNKHIDVFLPSLEAAVAYGRQKDTKVYILD